MAKHHKKLLVYLSCIGIFLSIMLSSCMIGDQIEIETGSEVRFYSFNSANIIESLDQGNKDVFTLLVTTPEPKASPAVVPVHWSQDDFFRVVQALHIQAWGEPLGRQHLWSMSFSMDCSGVDRKAFSYASFDTFKIVQTGAEEIRIEYVTHISPSEQSVYTSKKEFAPNAHDLKPIDLARYLITAEEALQIAEKNGGSEKRLGVANACEINAVAPGSNGKGWHIMYLNAHKLIESIFEITIDPQTGAFKILKSKP